MATTSRMLEVCCTHIAISDNLEAMGLKEQKTVNAICRGKTNLAKGENHQQTVCSHVDAAQSLTHPADHHAQQGMTTAKDVENEDIGSPSAEVDKKDPRTRDPNTTTEEEGQ